jgi:hypothetical protein
MPKTTHVSPSQLDSSDLTAEQHVQPPRSVHMRRLDAESRQMASAKGERSAWQPRHAAAWHFPNSTHEKALGHLIKGFAYYADAHRETFQSSIADDHILGPEWKAIGSAIIGLLNGESGRFDCGTLDNQVRAILTLEGVDADDI